VQRAGRLLKGRACRSGSGVVTAVVFAMADLVVFLTWFYAVVMLRQIQEEMTRTRLLWFACMFGLRTSVTVLARMMARRDRRVASPDRRAGKAGSPRRRPA
jgi:hypothetical protein